MQQNNVLCDLYIGKNAGKKLMQEIDETKQSLKIISPFLSAPLVQKLIDLYKNGIDVQLITTDTIMEKTEQSNDVFRQLISQRKIYNHKAKTLKFIISILCAVLWGASVFMIGQHFMQDHAKDSSLISIGISLFLAIVTTIIIFNIKTYHYHYDSIFPLKFLIAPDNAQFPIKTFVHSKVYVIDDEIMYWGSLNFTSKGTTDNYETSVRTIDKEAINKMSLEFHRLMKTDKLLERYLSIWGERIYSVEEKN